ncbi:MAG: methyltransferase domain-containing protein [Gemmatimonadota bacterium]|nr:MAG: methyltransferase domain-containing protein [Gemmatimonadota bacterium]
MAIAIVASPGRGQHKEHRSDSDPHRERWYWQMPLRVLREIGVESGMRVADVGAGDGYFTLRLAEAVGASGEVFASDIDADALHVLEERRDSAGIENFRIIQGTEDDPLLPDSTIDLVLIVNTIHLVDNPTIFLGNVRRSLRPGGRVVFVQWAAEKLDSEAVGWDATDRARYTLRTMLRTIYDGGLEVVRFRDFLPMQNIYVCEARTE